MIAWSARRPRQDARHPARRRSASISPFIGGGFGGKLFLRADALLAALGARAAGRPVKVALHAPADAQQHDASAGDDPAHPHRRDAATARSPRSATRAGPATCRAASPRRRSSQTRLLYAGAQPHDGDAACRARPARRQRDARAGRGAGHDGAGDRHGRDGREARASIRSSSASSTTPRSIPEKPERPFSQRQLVECLRTGAERFGWSKRNAAARAECATAAGWSAWAWPPPSATTC